ncbi:hypothetical protein LOK49_LG03G00860 [Camellia lanceoleosa]|uniref:Uncharacterized protein n=1 Tax=Camellia lanceoleosa TaxID=1840588 RepID=A0ACC0ICV4_9ERIC|nr:hypothetical protein LOK49_LG03G00860 [Camellia lanceoleosa]
MDPPPPAPPLSAAAPANFSYPDSVESSPRSRNTDSWDDPQYSPAVPVSGGGGAKLRLMCSYGGHIVPRPHDKSLCYAGGDTRIIVSDRHSSLSDLTQRLSKTLLDGRSFTLKYQLPNEDLDSLISVSTDEDLENMIEEYDRLTLKSSRLRLFLFPSKSDSGSSIGSLSLLENSTKSEDWFLSALNGSARGFSESASVNCLLGLDDDIAINAATDSSSVKELDSSASQLESNFGNVKGVNSNNNTNKQVAQDVHSVPDSPMLDTMSSFGSSASSPSLANLPPIRVHAEDQRAALGGIEEQFSQLSVGVGVGVGVQKQDDGGFSVLTTAPAPAPERRRRRWLWVLLGFIVSTRIGFCSRMKDQNRDCQLGIESHHNHSLYNCSPNQLLVLIWLLQIQFQVIIVQHQTHCLAKER